MAYLVNDPNKDAQENMVGMNVINPVSPSAPTDQPQQANPSQGAMPQANAQPAQNTRPSEGGKGGSGQFTNIRSYIEANKPQAQKMVGATTQGIQKQSQTIGQQVGQQQQQLQTQLAANDVKRQQAQEFAKNQITAAQGGQQLAQEDIAKFRGLASGEQTFNDVQQMNLAKQQMATKRLDQQAAQAGTEQGRRDLLNQTFGQRGQQYTRGQQGLDELIVSGSADARKALAEQTQQAAKEAQQGVSGALQQQGKDLQALQQANQQFSTGLQSQTTGAAQGIVTEADTALAAAKTGRQQQVADLEAQSKAYQDRISGLKSKIDMGSSENRAQLMKDLQFLLPEDQLKRLQATSSMDGNTSERDALERQKKIQQFIETGDRNFLTGIKHKTDGRNIEAMLRGSALGQLSNYDKDLGLVGLDPNIYKGSFDAEGNAARTAYGATDYTTGFGDLITGGGGRKYLDATRVIDELGALNKKVGAFNTEDYLQQQLGNVQQGLSLDQFRQGADLTRENVVDPNQISRYNALSQLAGLSGQDLIAERRGQALTADKFAEYMKGLQAK